MLKKYFLSLFLLSMTVSLISAPLVAWEDDEEWEQEEDSNYYNVPDNTHLNDEADWPTKNEDPMIDFLMH